MTYVCYQGNDRDCGFASLKMLLANKSKNKSYLYISKPAKKKDYTFYDLTQLARRYGFVLSSYQMPVEDFKDIPKGTIVLLKGNHAVYLIKVGKRRVTYFDPDQGKIVISNKEFTQRWTGILLECTNKNDALKIDISKPRMSPLYLDFIHYGLVGVIFACLLTGFYLIKNDTSIILTMAFLILFAVGELVENWYIIKELKIFDKKYLGVFFSKKANQKFSRYKYYCDYKSKYFISSKLLVSSLIMISAFSVLLCVNDYRNLFVFLILLMMKMLDNLLFSRKENSLVKEIEKIESIAFDSETTIVRSLKRANDLAGKSALVSSLKKVIYMFVCLCLAVGLMIVSDVTSTNFIIFHFGIYFMTSEAFENIIKFVVNSGNRKREKARFLDSVDL